MAEHGPQFETETGRLLPEGSGQVPLSIMGCSTCALKSLSSLVEKPEAEGADRKEGECYSGGQGFGG